jgi:peptidoglycan hydrolase CwlO-like protein
MSDTDEKIVKALENLQADVTALRTGQQALEAGQKTLQAGQQALQIDVSALKDVQQKQGKHLEALQADVKGLHGKVDTVELKVEAIHTYQKQAHTEIMDSLFQSNEITGKAQRTLEEQVEHIKKHVGLPPLK